MSELVSLRTKHVLELSPKAPFNFDATMHKPDHFPSKDNEWQPGIRWQTMLWNGEPIGLKLENRGTVDLPKLIISVFSKGELAQSFTDGLIEEINYRYNLRFDLTEFNHRFEDDPQLGPIIDRWRGMRPMSYSSLYEYLIIAIVLQNATVRRSVDMMQTLFQNHGTLLSYDNRELFCFWSPEAIQGASEQDLRELKIGYRAKSIKKVTEAFVRKEINECQLKTKTRGEQREALLRLYGIGPASVGYILFDVFHHWDELAHISPWEQSIYSKLFFDIDPSTPAQVGQLIEFFEHRFGEYKMLAVNYIWEDLFWKRKNEKILWLERLIRL